MNIKNVKKNLNNDLYTKIEGEDKIIEVVSSVVTNEELKNILVMMKMQKKRIKKDI